MSIVWVAGVGLLSYDRVCDANSKDSKEKAHTPRESTDAHLKP